MNLASLSKNPWLRRAVFCVVGILVVWALSWALVPSLLRHLVASRASEALGRQVSVAEVDFRPWSLELTLRDLVVRTLDGDAEQLAVERLYIDMELQSLVRLAPVLDALVVERPRLLLTHTQPGHYDIDDLIALASKPSDPAAAPLRFALHNLSLLEGAIDFRDTVAGQDHHLTALQLGLPFLSNFDSGRAVLVQPRLAFQLDGAAFDWSAQATPFADSRHAEVQARMARLDLKPFLPYWPKALPVRLAAGQLEADLKLVFEQAPEPKLVLSGTLGAHDVRVNDALGSPVLAFPSLVVDLAGLQPLQRSVHVRSVQWEGPSLDLRRDANGRFAWLTASAPPAPAPAPVAAAAAGKAEAVPAKASTAEVGWSVQVDRIALQHARVGWRDEGTQPAAVLSASDVALQVEALHWPLRAPARFQGSLLLGGAAEGVGKAADSASGKRSTGGAASGAASGRLHFAGQGTDRAAAVALRAEGLPLAAAAPYLARYLNPTLQGRLSLVGGLGWRAPDLAFQLNSLTVDALRLKQGEQELAAWDQLSLSDTRVDLAQRTASAGVLSLSGPRATVARDAQGHWMFEPWLKAQDAAAAPQAHGTGAVADRAAATSAQPAGWQWRLGQLALRDGSLGWRDATAVVARKPAGVALDVAALQLQAGPFSGGPTGLGVEPVELQATARVGAPGRGGAAATEPGRLDYKGRVKLVPFSTQGRLEFTRLPLHAVEPYFGDVLNLELPRADASFRGSVDVAVAAAGATVRVKGDGALEDVRANSVLAQVGTDAGPPTSDELLSWKALSLRGIDLALQPGTPLSLGISETALSDFYARVVINDQGRINLQNLMRSSAPEPTPVKGAAAAKVPPAQPAPASAAASKPVIRMGPITLLNGRVLFSDRFVRPNYSASLSELTGRLGAFSSVLEAGSAGLADLELRGRAEGTASLEVSGKLNPLATPLALDIQGKVRELDLPPLSPYTIKYAGHGIERGKLSVNVAYKIDPDGRLNASNNIILNQLSFGEQVEGAPASLPVKLAVALLADRDGVIDINLPISGSLNDPDFRLAPIVGRLLLNLVAKAVTSPFSLLASAFGGGHSESNEIAFAPGGADLMPDARQRLDKVAQALQDRPALKLTVVGQVNVQVEREGYRRQQLAQMMLAEKRRQAVLAGHKGTEVEAVTEAEQPALLKAVYQRADLPKPRNLLGMAKDLPGPEMEALLLASVPVSDDLLQALAVERGVVVRDYLLGRAVAVNRLFLGAPKTLRNEGAWTPSAELLLDTR